MPKRRRCLTTGCNPLLPHEDAASAHRSETGHRTAAWPVRSAEGRRRARARNKKGYYDRYNVGEKSAEARGLGASYRYEAHEGVANRDDEAMSEYEDSKEW